MQVQSDVQLGGGPDINRAIAYCEDQINSPVKTHLILISDLSEGGNRAELLGHIGRLVASGDTVIALLALTDTGRPG